MLFFKLCTISTAKSIVVPNIYKTVSRHICQSRTVFSRIRPRPTSITSHTSRTPSGSFTGGRPLPPVENVPPVKFKLLLRSGLFTFITVQSLLVGSTIWSFEDWRAKRQQTLDSPKKAVGTWNPLPWIRKQLEQAIGRPLQPKDIFWGFVACNVVVFLLLRSPLGSTFIPYFTNSPYNPVPALSMLLSVFAHVSPLHLALNMYVLHSFSEVLIRTIGAGDYVYLMIGGGTFASLIGLLSKAARRSTIPSIGASGGICAVLGAFCLLQPDAKLCVPFVVDVFPHSFQASSAVWTMLAIEAAATLFIPRSFIDHAAHFGGLWFGMMYSTGGFDAIWKRRSEILSMWRQLTGK